MTMVQALTVMSGIYMAGILFGRITKGRVPTALFTLPVMLILFWTHTITAEDIDASGFDTLYNILNCLIIVNVGTSLDFKMLVKERKLALVSILSLVGCGVLVLTVGAAIFGRDFSILSFPSLCGGMIATMLMYNAAIEKGLTVMAATLMFVWSVQNWISLPVVSNAVRIEANSILKKKRAGEYVPTVVNVAKEDDEKKPARKKLIDRIPKQYDTPYVHFFLCAFFSMIAAEIAKVTGPMTKGVFGVALVSVLIGVLARELGLISKNPLDKAFVMPLFMMALIMYMRRSLASLTPQAFVVAFPKACGMVLLGLVGLLVVGIIVGKFAGLSVPMSIAVAIQAYMGYPTNYQVSLETIETITQDPEEIEFLKDEIVSKIIVGGVVSVSIISVIVGSVMVSMI